MGYIWQYWPWYEKNSEFTYLPGIPTDYGGFTPQQLYVTAKFADYKEETLHHLDIKMYNNIVLTKVNLYMESNRVKNTKANWICDRGALHYGIEEDTPISKEQVISIILYTDFSEYCAKFSATFRKLSSYETFNTTKKRNAEFAHQSRLLRECVEVFSLIHPDDGEKGPFYSGVDCVLAMPQFAIRLSSPTSTSKHIEVSMNFAKKEGIIITLNNTGHEYAVVVRFFDCSWVSQYPDEDERVFAGLYIF